MELKLTYYGNPVLRKNCKTIEKITQEIQDLAAQMLETMKIENGIGLAGPQVNQPIRIFITCVPIPQEDETWAPGTPRVFINPKILSVSEETEYRNEGCLSIPEVYGEVERPIQVTIEATGIDGKVFKETFDGLEARCVLHENDHINGKLFVDRMDKKQRKLVEPQLREIKKKFNN